MNGMRLIKSIMKQSTRWMSEINVVTSVVIIDNPNIQNLGRWKAKDEKTKNIIAHLANYDNCGISRIRWKN